MSRPALEVRGLGKRYRIAAQRAGYRTLREAVMQALRRPFSPRQESADFWALRGVSFDLAHGEVLGILGANGAGKSTLLKVLSGVTAPTEGSAKVHGSLGALLEVGTGFHPELTGRENIYLSGAILGMRRAEVAAKFDAIAEFAEVTAFLDTPVKHYSSGMYVRLAFAVAAHLQQDILVVDEVLAVGDAEFQRRCMGRISQASRQEGRTILLVSHNMSAIGSLCSRALYLEHGRVAFEGAPLEAIRRYLAGGGTESSADLAAVRHGRRGARDNFELRRLEVLDTDGKPCRSFAMGAPMLLRVHLSCRRGSAGPRVGVMLTNAMDVLIHDFTSAFDGFFPDLAPGDHCLEARVSALNVYPGTYTLGAWVQQVLGEASDDYVRGAITIEVMDAKQVGDPRAAFDKVSKANTEVYVPCQWQLRVP